MADQQTVLTKLIAHTALGDPAAFKSLYDQTSAAVFGLAMQMLRERSRAEELVQDVYLRVWSRASEYHVERGRVLTWIFAITRYRALDILRSDARRPPLDPIDEQTIPALDSTESSPLSHSLEQCFKRLADSQRQSIQAAFFDGMTHAELATQFATPIGTIKARIRRGLIRLKECLQQ